MIAPAPLEEDYSKDLDLALWRRLWAYTTPYRREVFWLCFFGAVTAVVDTLFPLVTARVIDNAIDHGRYPAPIDYALYAVLMAMLAGSIWVFICLAGKLRTYVSHDIRKAGFARLQQLSFRYYDRRPVGWLMARMTSDCERLSNVLAWGVLDLAWAGTIVVCMSGILLVLDVGLALLVLAVIPVLAWVSLYFRKRILKTARDQRKANSRITASYNEGIVGVRTSKVFVRERQNLAEFQGLTTDMFGASVKNALYSALYLSFIVALGSLGTGIALAAGGFKVTTAGISIGTLVAFLLYTRHFFEPVQQLAHWFGEMQMAQASAERILGLIDTEPEIRDSPAVLERIAAGPRGPGVAPDGYADRIGVVAFEHVGFHYEEGAPVLDDFTLEVAAGETIALVGATGGGKTTIVNLLCRFYEPTAGRIRIDGVDYRERGLAWLHSQLGIVLQTPHLFSGSVRDNLRYGHLEATDDEIVAAAQLAGAHEFIVAMENGYGTDVGEGGIRLSTGQKQLLSFARAVLARPQILVMDEATSSVDTETEQRIQAGLGRVLAGRMSFVIAHRLSTIRSADRILVIEKGKIVEHGAHHELLSMEGRYHHLYKQQSLRESMRAWA